jgi:hypothetical protein
MKVLIALLLITLATPALADSKPSAKPRKSVDAGKQKEPRDKEMVEGGKKDAAPRVNLDLEVARVKKEIRKIQAMPISHDSKLKKLQALRDREIARDHPFAIKDTIKKCIDTAKETSNGVQPLGH